jgi:hypothetical protein
VIDVPFKGDAKVSSLFVPENNQIMITACTPALVFHRNLKVRQKMADKSLIPDLIKSLCRWW